MEVTFLLHEVSDLCIGKPPVRSLPTSATVGEALLALKECDEDYLTVWSTRSLFYQKPSCAGKVCMADLICYLCSEENVENPSFALYSPVSVLLKKGAPELVRCVGPRSSIVEALNQILDGAQYLLVPIRGRKGSSPADYHQHCCLTQEDFIRFFLNSIGHFSHPAALSISTLGLVRPATLAIPHHQPAISSIPLLKQAIASQTAVAVVTDDGKLLGEISPSTLAVFGDSAVAAAVCALSVDELMGYIDFGIPLEDVTSAVEVRLQEKGLNGMLHLLEFGDDDLSSLGSTSSSSSSSDEETAEKKSGGWGKGKRCSRSRSHSARMSRRSSEGAVICNPESSLVAVILQALTHRVSYVWVVEEDYTLAGVATFSDILKVFRDHLGSR